VLGVLPAILLAWAFYAFNLFSLGPILVLFFINLMIMGWAVALGVVSLILRHGAGAESLAWGILFGMAPFSAVFYPVSVLPAWLQYVAWALPPTYVFEGMRALLIDHTFRADLMIDSLVLNAVLFIASFLIFLALLRSAKRHGSLLGGGE